LKEIKKIEWNKNFAENVFVEKVSRAVKRVNRSKNSSSNKAVIKLNS